MRALKIAATGMSAQQLRVEVISNNPANMNTTGYNARRAEFSDLHYQQQTRAGTINATDGTWLPTGVQLGLGVRPSAVTVNIAQGALSETGGNLDLAIEGGGYFFLATLRAISLYTRRQLQTVSRRGDRNIRRVSCCPRGRGATGCAQRRDQR